MLAGAEQVIYIFFSSPPGLLPAVSAGDPGAIVEVEEPDVIVNVPARPANRSAEEAMEGPVQANVPAASPWVPLCHAAIWPRSSPQ